MASWIKLTLDTTSPLVDLHMPSISTNESYEDIFLVAKEELDIRHEFYIIDSLGTKHNFTLALEKDKKTFYGRISFQAFPKGIATAYFRVFDIVWNSSALLTKSFNIVNPQNIKMYLSDSIPNIEDKILIRNLQDKTYESIITLDEKINLMHIFDELKEGES